ncbi:MAG: glycosyl hydrolase [Actinopolymorphaceae bacterium]
MTVLYDRVVRANDTPDRIDLLRSGFADPPSDCRPMMRWWWFGPDVDRDELARELDAMRLAGLGGAEVAVVYPLSDAPDNYLSETFLANLRFAADEARRLGLRLDLTVGSGWSYGGAHVTADLASRRLHWERQDIGLAAIDLPAPVAWPGDEVIAAYVREGADAGGAWEPLRVVDGVVQVPEGRGPRVLLIAMSRLTGQQVKRAAAGAEGWVLDHYSAAATARHIEAVGEPLLSAVPTDLLGSVFCDSLEVYAADWTPGLLEEFRKRRGYEPRPLLWMLHVDNRNVDSTNARQFRADYYRTLSELCEENFIGGMRRWAASRGVAFRIQAYGVPPVGISSYRYADGFEGEGWGWKDIPPTRWASSAAQIYGRSVVSSEIWTWAHSPSFRATPLDLKGEAHEHLLLGINQFIGHGWPYSPPDAEGLGWFFYAAGALDDRNPWWPAAAPMNRYLQRLCWLMRQGERIADVGVYAASRDVYAGLGSSGRRALDLWHSTREHIGYDLVRGVREAGFDFVLFDDDATEVLDPERFSVIVLPYVEDLPEETLVWLKSVERAGGRVCSVGGRAAAGTALGEVSQLVDLLHTDLTADVTPTTAHPTVGTVHRRHDDVDIYLVVNTGPETVQFDFGTRDRHVCVERWDPTTGQVLDRILGQRSIPLTLEAYEASVLIGFNDSDSDSEDGNGDPEFAAEPADWTTPLALDGGWSIRFGDDDIAVSVSLPHRWEDDPGRWHYSGSARYTTSIHLDQPPGECWLDLGTATQVDTGMPGEPGLLSGRRGPAYRAEIVPPVGEIAEVTVNGNHAGILWSPPYRLPIGDHLRGGENRIEIRVSNTNANALAVDRGVAAFTETANRHYGNRFGMQRIDRATVDVNSGLLAVPRLIVGDG